MVFEKRFVDGYNGCKPSNSHTLDRLDPTDRIYGPGRCRWADKREQTVNRQNTIWVTWNNEPVTLAKFAEAINAEYSKVSYRHSRGWTTEQIAAWAAGGTDRSYCPLRYRDDPLGEGEWYRKYRDWTSKVSRKYSGYVCPEVFDLVGVSAVFAMSERWMSNRGYFELTPFDTERAEELARSEVGRVYIHGVEWMNYALECLGERDPQLAASLSGGRERYARLADLGRELGRSDTPA